MLLVATCAILGGAWRRWLGAANTGPRAPKIVAGFLLFMLAVYPAWAGLVFFNFDADPIAILFNFAEYNLKSLAVAVVSAGLTLVMWVEGHGQGLDVGTVHGTAMSDLKYMAARYAAIVVPAAGLAMGVTGNFVPFLIAVPIGMLIGASWFVCFKLKLPQYTEYAEVLAGALAFGLSAAFFI
jgi:hypothetical protein